MSYSAGPPDDARHRVLRDFYSSLEACVANVMPVGRRLPRPQENSLLRHCFVPALLEEIARPPAPGKG